MGSFRHENFWIISGFGSIDELITQSDEGALQKIKCNGKMTSHI